MTLELKKFCKEVLSGNKISNKSTGTIRNQLKNYILEEKVIEYKCSECNCEPIHNGKVLVLQLDHINGDPKDNIQSNLRWLCPNCHSQTHSFAGRNTKGKKRSNTKYICQTCSKEYQLGVGKHNKKYCSISCSNESKRKLDWSSIDINDAIEKYGIRKLEKMWNLSNVAIYKQRDKQRAKIESIIPSQNKN